jgi:tRNA-splicing ligase RtcB
MAAQWSGKVNRIDDYRWEIPTSYKAGMRVAGLIYASQSMLEHIFDEQVFEQVANVAFLPGIVGHSLAMPDIHWGYGFPIGGVAATRVADGVISPGGVGFDINCGVRLLRTNLTVDEVRPEITKLVNELYENVPSGLGSEGKIRVSQKELDQVLTQGSRWALEKGLGEPEDIVVTEEAGCIKQANPDKVSVKAKKRGIPQLGTLGSGNHFLEVEAVTEIYDPAAAGVMGITGVGQILVLIHTGSRGLGHEVCGDYVRLLGEAVKRYGIALPDRQLACAPVSSAEGQDYLEAMACAANYAWTNRQCIAHWTRESFARVFGRSQREIGLEQIYDVCHNIAKIEEHSVGGRRQRLCVHRKGATRAFPPGHRDVPERCRDIGQPVLIPGDMGRGSFVALGTERAMAESFGSTCHGAGRLKSRSAARRSLNGAEVARQLASRGITVKTGDLGSLAEEASPAYKDVAEVVEVTDKAGLSRKVVRTEPVGVIKG